MRQGEDSGAMTTKRGAFSVATIAAVLLLSACASSNGPGSGPVTVAPTGVEGEWLSADGVAVSRFSGGVFETVATDTGNKLADSNYSYLDTRTVQITVVSLIRQTTSTVNCAMATQSQLNCTSSTGQQFILTRKVGQV